jgi:hypothetical protein
LGEVRPQRKRAKARLAKLRDLAAVVRGEFQDLIQPGDLAALAVKHSRVQCVGQLVEVRRAFEAAEAVPHAFGLDFQHLLLAEVIERPHHRRRRSPGQQVPHDFRLAWTELVEAQNLQQDRLCRVHGPVNERTQKLKGRTG